MDANPQFAFKAKIYKTGINFCVDVPEKISAVLVKNRGYIRIEGWINGFHFRKSLVPVKNSPYRLFVNMITLKGAKAGVGDTASFLIQQDLTPVENEFEMHPLLQAALRKYKLAAQFKKLTPSRQKDILKYLFYLKSEETVRKNVMKVIDQLSGAGNDVRIP